MAMIKNFLMKKMLKRQMKDVPEEQQEMILKMVEENPEFFEKIAKEIEQKTKEGKDKTAAAFEVMRKHQAELQRIMMGK
ncbi:MAG TPA: hypothetical protein VFM02_00350 [Candidatus Paceibacterota bacterium]|nr:hypothetical protein [Candidatus Paceibacterota bacterium]